MAEYNIWFEAIRTTANVASAVITGAIGIFVYRYTRRRDKLDFIARAWTEQQSINIAQLNSDQNLISIERMVYGNDYKEEVDDTRLKYHLFLYINRVLQFYNAYSLAGILTEEEFVENAEPTVRLISNHQDLVLSLLSRGYPDKFARRLEALLKEVPDSEKPSTVGSARFGGRSEK